MPNYSTLADQGTLLQGSDEYEVWEIDGQLWLVEFDNGTAYVSKRY